ncbi:MAG: phosphoribosylamine--glycine ligase [Candidatus Omnitrophota bacterium]
MKVLVIGSGGREHAIAWKVSQSPLLRKLYAAPGNAGIEEIAECHPIKADDIEGLCHFAKTRSIDLTIVGPEAPLVAGIVDRFQKEGLPIFGPSQQAAMLEGSKAFAKEKMSRFGIPTADYQIFSHMNEAKQYVIEAEMPIVIKADGLAAGKGVVICENSKEAVTAITQMMGEGVFGNAGKQIVVEQLLRGEEISILAICDGEKMIPLASAQDHKRAYDHDRGPNTGGMGAYSPCPQIPDSLVEESVRVSILPMLQGMAREGMPYRGILYAGLMLTKEGPYVLEYNCRMGDPETEAILPRLRSDLLQAMAEVAAGHLTTTQLTWDERACMTVVIASGGYPGHFEKGYEVQGLEALKGRDDLMVFHAGTGRRTDGRVVTQGGRVFAVSALGKSLKTASELVYQEIDKINFQEKFFRRDIGRRALEVYR